MKRLRFPGETEDEFRRRVQRAARVARILVDACLRNVWVQELIADPVLCFYTLESFTQHPVVCVDFDEAYAIANIGERLAATKSKAWGNGPRILPLEESDYVDPRFIGYVYKESSRYNRRFEQPKRLKQMLGREYRSLVETAKRFTKTIFLDNLTEDQANALRRRICVEPGVFWGAAHGRVFRDLPKPPKQLMLFET